MKEKKSSLEGLTIHQLSSWKGYILNLLKEEEAYSPYTLIGDFGTYDDSYEIGRVVQILLDEGKIEFNDEGRICLPTSKEAEGLNQAPNQTAIKEVET